jgi:hypothetical protein
LNDALTHYEDGMVLVFEHDLTLLLEFSMVCDVISAATEFMVRLLQLELLFEFAMD